MVPAAALVRSITDVFDDFENRKSDNPHRSNRSEAHFLVAHKHRGKWDEEIVRQVLFDRPTGPLCNACGYGPTRIWWRTLQLLIDSLIVRPQPLSGLQVFPLDREQRPPHML